MINLLRVKVVHIALILSLYYFNKYLILTNSRPEGNLCHSCIIWMWRTKKKMPSPISLISARLEEIWIWWGRLGGDMHHMITRLFCHVSKHWRNLALAIITGVKPLDLGPANIATDQSLADVYIFSLKWGRNKKGDVCRKFGVFCGNNSGAWNLRWCGGWKYCSDL